MSFADELESALEARVAAGSAEVFEDGRLVAPLAELRYEIRQDRKHPLLHLWSEERNLVRRILRVVENSAERLVLEVERFGRSRPGRLEFVRTDAPRRVPRLRREKFRQRFEQILAEQFPDEQVGSLTAAADLEHSLSGSYARGVMQRGRRAWAVIGAAPAEDPATLDGMLTFGLLWLHWTREHMPGSVVQGLRVFLPEGSARVTLHRLQALGKSLRIEVYEVLEGSGRVRRLDPEDVGNVATWLTPRREVEQTLAAAGDFIERVIALDPDAIDAVVPPGLREVALRYRGLEFARWRSAGVVYGLGGKHRPLGGGSWKPLEALVRRLAAHRVPDADDLNDPLYRASAERWLESLALRTPSRIDAHIDPRCLYAQVPAFSAGDRGVIDLLGVTRQGRLMVIELKATEDLQLVLQAVDYWLRVRRHHQDGDFQRYGYFTTLELQSKPPLLYLVAPSLRFHPTTDILLRFLAPEVEVVRLGLNENWRHGLRTVFRQ